MSSLRHLPDRRVLAVGPRLELHYLAQGGDLVITPVTENTAEDLGRVRLEHASPIRSIPAYHGQKHTPGRYWCATTGALIGYESFLEAQHLTLLDFDPGVTAISSQAFMLDGVDHDGDWRHFPDLFVRRSDGSALVVDVKNPRHLGHEDVLLQARRTEYACCLLGWAYQMTGGIDPQLWANVSWLAGYRRSPHAGTDLIDRIITLATSPVALTDLLSFLGNQLIARSVIFHLCWRQHLVFDLTRPLRESTVLRANPLEL